MRKKKFFSFGVMIVLIIACVVLIFTLFIVSSVPAVNNPGPGADVSSGAEDDADATENLPNPAVDDWELPIVVSVTGSDSASGRAAIEGFNYGIKNINETGGIRGLPVNITVRDTASNISEVSSEIEMLTSDSLVIMGPPVETAYKAGVQAFFNAGLPTVGAATDANNRDAYQPFAISCITEPELTAESMAAAWTLTESFTKVCILYAPMSADRVEIIEDVLINEGKVTERMEIGNEAFDAATIAENAYSTGADAYYIDTIGEDIFRIITQLRFAAGENAGNLKILCGPLAADKELLNAPEGFDVYGVQVWTTVDPGQDVEKRKAFNETMDNSIDDPAYYPLAVDYYQSALMLKQAFETLALTREPETLIDERLLLAGWLFNSERIHTEFGDFHVSAGGKIIEAKLYTITEKGFQ